MPELFGRQFTRIELEARIGSLSQIGGITPFQYAEGRADGVRAFRIDTGRLCVDLVADRTLDVARAALDGVPFAWRTANEITAPGYYDATGDAWLRSFFGGWLTTCGLSNFGPAGEDAHGSYGLHGRIDNLPASELAERTWWEGDRCFFSVSGVVRETKALDRHLVLLRTWTTELGSTMIRLEDRVRNAGGTRAPHMILYHCNAGFPIVGPDARVYLTRTGTEPRDKAAAAGIDTWDHGGEPHPGFAEQVFIHAPHAETDGRARAIVANVKTCHGRGLGFEVAYDPTTLPAIFTWRMLGYGDYVMSVEPANTCAIQGRTYAGRHGLLPFLEPGEERVYRLDLTALSGDALHASVATIASASATTAED